MAPPTPEIALQERLEALKLYAQALKVYTAEIDDIIQRLQPGGRNVYRRAITNVEDFLKQRPTTPPPGTQFAEAVFKILGELDELRRDLDAGAVVALNPRFLKDTTLQASKTYSEELKLKAAQLRKARDRAADETFSAWVGPVTSSAPPRAVAELFHRSSRSPSAASLYAAVLETWLAQGVEVSALVEDAKNSALGLELDTLAAAHKAVEARAGLHPIQAMGITFGLTPAPAEPGGSLVMIDVSLPQARTSIQYNLAPLIDARTASQFGQLATVNSGLSFRLMTRLQTIVETEIKLSSVSAITVSSNEPPRILRTTNHGTTFETLVPRKLAPDAYTLIGAGPRPRVERLGGLLEEAVFAADGIRVFAEPDKLVNQYTKQVELLAPNYSQSELGRALVFWFTNDYDSQPVASADELLDAVLGQRRSRNLYRTYIAKAIAAVSKQGADRQLLREEMGGGRSALFGPHNLSGRGGRREILLTQMTGLRASVGAVRQQLLTGFLQLDGGQRARAIFASKTVAKEALAASAARRARVLDLYQNIINGAVRSVEKKANTITTRLSLKLYVLEHGGVAV